MRIVFKKLEIHNFMAFADEVFDFDEHLGLNLICGKNNDIPGSRNGTGKSCLSEALCFALYGQTRNNIKNGNIWNKYVGSKEMRVVSYFSIDKHDYKVASGFTKNGSPYCNLYEIVDSNEIDLTKSGIIETRKFLENEILHCDITIFLRTILLSSDQNYNFFRLRKADKKEFIENLFDISIFGDMYASIHRDILQSDKQLISIQNKLLVLNNQNEDYRLRIDKYENDRLVKITKLNETLSSISAEYDKIKNLKIDNNSAAVEKYQLAIDKLNKSIDKLQIKANEIIAKNNKFDVALHKIHTATEQKQKLIDKHSELLNKLCDDCKEIFSDYYNITQFKNDIQQLMENKQLITESFDKNKNELDEINKKINNFSDKVLKANKKIKELTLEYNKAQKELQQFETQIYSISNDLEKTKKLENPYIDLFDKNKIEIEGYNSTLDELSTKYKYLKFAENIVSQDTLRKFIISDLIGLLNNKIKLYLTKFGAKYSVKFDADMDYEFTTEAGTYEYDNFSAGERARLMIATCFAFRDFMHIRNNLSANVLILDEFIDGAIDSIAIESILEILKTFSETWNQNIYVISHRKEINNDIFNNIIQIVKTNNISKITYIDK